MLKRILTVAIAAALLVSCSQPVPEVSASQSETSSVAPSSSPVIENPSTPGIPDSSPAIPEQVLPSSPSLSSAATDFASKTWWQKGLAPESFSIVLDNPSEPTEGYCYDAAADKLVLTDIGRTSDRVSYRIYDDTAKLSKGCYSVFYKPDNSNRHNLGYIANTAREAESIGARILPNSFFELVANDDTKYTGEFYEQGIRLTQALPGKDKGRSVNLAIDNADYMVVLGSIDEIWASGKASAASWLTMMRYSRLVSARVSYGTDKVSYERSQKGELPWQVDMLFNTLQGRVGSAATATNATTLPDAAVAILEFNNGLIYTIHVNDKQLLVTASGIDNSLLYELGEQSSVFRGLIRHAEGNINPDT